MSMKYAKVISDITRRRSDCIHENHNADHAVDDQGCDDDNDVDDEGYNDGEWR